MIKNLLKIVSIGILVTLLSTIMTNIVLADQPLKVDKYNPVFAKDVELAKKVQIKGDKGSQRPSKSTSTVATGILGAFVTGTKYAIVIGISNYPGTINDLECADNDAFDMVTTLHDAYGFNNANIKTFIDVEGTLSMVATRVSIITYLEELIPTVKSDDEVVFFFSGHGGRGKANDGDKEVMDECIWVHDGNSNLIPIYDGELASIFDDIKTSRVIFIFDSCYAGGMTDLKKDGRVIVMGSGENSLSYELSTISNGEFTYYLVDQGMTNYLADKYNDVTIKGPDVTVEEAWDYAKSNCRYDAITISDSFTNDLLP